MDSENVSTIYEIELDVLLRLFRASGCEIGDGRRAMAENLIEEAKRKGLTAIPTKKPNKINHQFKEYSAGKRSRYGLTVDNGLSVDIQNQDDQKGVEIRKYASRIEACPNPKCRWHGKVRKGNIVSNGSYRTKEGTLSHRFLCKECGESFCSRTRSIFYGLRSPEGKVLRALKLLAKGMPLNGVVKVLGVDFRTVQRWLGVTAEQSEKIDAILMKKLKVSQAELDVLWDSVKKNSLRQRANRWRSRYTSCEKYLPSAELIL